MNKVKIGDVSYVLKGKRLIVDITVPPKEWPNGAAVYRERMADRGPRWREGFDPNRGLIGHTIKRNGKVSAWRHIHRGRHQYVGEFENFLQAVKGLKHEK